jgi:hypothetical protein
MKLNQIHEMTGSFVRDTEVKFTLELTSPNDEPKLEKIAAGFITCNYKKSSPTQAEFHVKGCTDGGVLSVLRQFNIGSSDASSSRRPKNQ